jgi:hypothetical protein
MKNEYVKLIEEQDQVLSTLREFWMDEDKPEGRAKQMRRINKALDHRLTLMAKRDAAV